MHPLYVDIMKLDGIDYRRPQLKKSFANLENLVIEYSSLSENLLRLNDWFPALKSLRLFTNTYRRSNEKFLRRSFPNLNSFAVETSMGFPYSDFKSLLQHNRQIRSLNIVKCDILDDDINLFEFINETLPDLEELICRRMVYDLVNSRTSLKFKNLRKLDGSFGNFDNWRISFEFEHSLQYLSMQVESITSNVVDLIKIIWN